MTISVACPHCRRSYAVPSEFAGRQFRCRACGDPILIPDDSPVETVPAATNESGEGPPPDESAPAAEQKTPPALPAPAKLRPKPARDRDRDEMPSTIRLALVFGAIHMVEDLFFVLSGFSVAADAPQTAGPVILAGLVRLGIELTLFTGLLRRSASARIASLVLTSLGLGVQVLALLTVSWLAISGRTLPDIDPEELRILASLMACCGGIGILLRIGGIATLVPGSAAQWCDVRSRPDA